MLDTILRILWESWLVLGQMAPYLLFGFGVAGVLSVCISPEFIERHLGGRGFLPVLKASVLGVPLPMCSCSVIPVSASFRRHGAGRAAVAALLLSTPQIGIDSIVVTYSLLGAAFAVYRPVVALAPGLLGGFLVMLFTRPDADPAGQANAEANAESDAPVFDACCCEGQTPPCAIRRILEYGFVTLPRDIGPALLVGVAIAGGIAALVPPNLWHPYLGGGFFSILLLMALGIPIYVCSSASVPIALGLIHLGASPGAALAFLISGPASNAASVTMLWKVLGRPTALIYLLTIAISAVAAGLALDGLMPAIHLPAAGAAAHAHETAAFHWLSSLWAILLLALLTGLPARFLPSRDA